MEVNCNGHASTAASEASLERQGCGTRPSAEALEDRRNANLPESSTENADTSAHNEDSRTCNGSSAAPVSPESIGVELKEGDQVGKQEDEMDTQGENKRGNGREHDNQNGRWR